MFPAGVAGIRVRTVLSSGLALRVAESGATSSPPVLLLHGWGASIYMWRDWFAPLAGLGMRAVAVDLPGHGLSDKPVGPGEYRLSRQVELLRELMEVEELAGALVIAQSMGGTIALELAMADATPIGRLALVNPAIFGTVGVQRLARWVSPPVVDTVLDWLVPRWIVARAHRFVYTEGSRVTERDIDEYWAPSQFPAHVRAMRRLLHEFEWTRTPPEALAARMRTLAAPVLAVLGGRDRLVRDARPYARALVEAGAPLVVHELAEGGHAVNEEEAKVVLERVMDFVGW